jgi:hypothetical protein
MLALKNAKNTYSFRLKYKTVDLKRRGRLLSNSLVMWSRSLLRLYCTAGIGDDDSLSDGERAIPMPAATMTGAVVRTRGIVELKESCIFTRLQPHPLPRTQDNFK